MKIGNVWVEIILNKVNSKGACRDCPLRDSLWIKKKEPLLLRPDDTSSTRIMVITEGPNKSEPLEILTTITNHPTYTFLFTLFEGRFNPVGSNANVYWTHVRKCFLNDDKSAEKQAREHCSAYLSNEVEAVKPMLILCVGKSAYFAITNDKKKLEEVFESQSPKSPRTAYGVEYVVVPHPSGLNRYWNNPSAETLRALKYVQGRISAVLGVH